MAISSSLEFLLSEIYYFILFCLESKEEEEFLNVNNNLDHKNSNIDWELDNNHFLEFNHTEDKDIYDFII